VSFVLPVFAPLWISRLTNEGGGVSSAYITSGSILVAALVGFLLAAVWAFRRYRTR
jgi:hypothetical protein